MKFSKTFHSFIIFISTSKTQNVRKEGKYVYDILHLVLTIMEDFVRQVFVFNISEYHKWHDNADNIIEQISSLQKYYYNTLDQIYCIHGGKIPISLERIFYK